MPARAATATHTTATYTEPIQLQLLLTHTNFSLSVRSETYNHRECLSTGCKNCDDPEDSVKDLHF